MLTLKISISKIQQNLRIVRQLIAPAELVFVCKCVCSDEALLRRLDLAANGVRVIADSEAASLARLAGFAADNSLARMLLRPAAPAEAAQVVASCEIAAASEWQYLKALNAAAAAAKKPLEIMLMLDLGDLREGYFYDEKILKILRKFPRLSALKLRSLGVNFACLNAVLPSVEALERLCSLAAAASEICGYSVGASGGNSSSLGLARARKLPAVISELRIGDGVLFGKDCFDGSLVPGCADDAFCIKVPVVELKTKPSLPVGERGLDAFGREVSVRDEGPMRRAVLAIGKASCDEAAMRFGGRYEGLRLLGASSDHLVCCAQGCPLRLGEKVRLILGYQSVLRAYVSPQIKRKFV